MDMNTLIDQIIARVAEKMAAAELPTATTHKVEKPRLLILSREHGTNCHAILDSGRLQGTYDTACALLQEYQVEIEDYEAVVLYGLSIEALSKLASGACDTPFTSLAAKALLLGKRIFVPTEEVELYHYASTAPAAYYAMMEEKLRLLIDSGVIICAQANLEAAILSGSAPAPAVSCGQCSPVAIPEPVCIVTAPIPEAVPVPASAPRPVPCDVEKTLDKRVITERDILRAREEGVTVLHIGERGILTELAKDMAKDSRIKIMRA